MTQTATAEAPIGWVDLWPTKPTTRGPVAAIRGTVKPGVPMIRLFSKTQGYLNVEARKLLFDGEKSGWIRFKRHAQQGTVAVVSVAQGTGYRVGVSGHINVSAVTDLIQTWPLAYRLALNSNGDGLVFAERIRGEVVV